MQQIRILGKVAQYLGAGLLATAMLANAQTPYGDFKPSKNSFGQPDIGGFWTNVTLTPLARPKEFGDRLVYTQEEVAKIEERVKLEEAEANRPTDPNAPAEFRHESELEVRPEFQAAGGDVGGYNYFWLDPGQHVMRVAGEPRTSILTTPDGRIPARKDGATPSRRFYGQRPQGYVGYEVRSLGERCVIGFGRNGGPPMFANGFYNNNYQIVQAPDHVMILVEMNHDARIIRLNDKTHAPDHIRPWFGDSIGWWESNTLVVETTNLPPEQTFYGSWENLKVIERFTPVAKDRLHYAFTIEDPSLWDKPWGGEYEFNRLDGEIYEYACHEGNYALPGILRGLLGEADK